MKQGLSLRVSQHLALTPQLQQSIRLLQLSTLELNQEVEQMLDDNPFLERAEDEAEREAFGLAQADAPVAQGDVEYEHAAAGEANEGSAAPDMASPDAGGEDNGPELDWDGDGALDIAPNDTEWGVEASASGAAASGANGHDAAQWTGAPLALQAHLTQQAAALRLSAAERAALDFLIGSLNDDGLLEESLEALGDQLTGDEEALRSDMAHHLTVALGLLQSFDPAGVGARSLGECLRLQLLAQRRGPLPQAEHGAALKLCDAPLELLAKRDFRRLSLLTGEDEAALKAGLARIARLDPRPGRRFEPAQRNAVVPDVLVTRAGQGTQARLLVRLNEEAMPRLRVHDAYAGLLKGRGHVALASRLQEARWFIKNIKQRFDTILRVSRAIVERQKSFFTHGELAMRPMVLREIADELGLHESTISRVTTAKYMATPMGTFELKYFFGSGLSTEAGGNASSTAVRALIRQFIAGEPPARPLSDNKISQMLKEQGIECARRTVAKYREALRIAPASLRKAS
jgi:RNA polymerase sigma-54 factor